MKQQKFRASRGVGLFENFCCAHIMVTPRSWSLPADENPTWPWVSIHRCSSVLYRYLRTCLTILFICLWFWTHPWFNMSPQSKLLIKRYFVEKFFRLARLLERQLLSEMSGPASAVVVVILVSVAQMPGERSSYCWWLKSCTSWYGEYHIIYRLLYIPGG